jgi:transposase
MVMIGINPHKSTHTAVAIDDGEQVLGERVVRATAKQVPELLEWAKSLDGGDRVWAIESAGGLGYLLAQQFLAAGETVVDIPATLASRVRPLGTGRSDKNDPNDARSVAIAALRAPELVPVRVEDHASVLRLLARRHTQLAWTYNKTACRLHALAAELVPGGISQEIVVCQARSLLEQHQPAGAVAVDRHLLAIDLLDELDRLGTQRQALRKRINRAVAASGTTRVDIFGIGDVIAAVIVGQVGDIARFRTADRFAAYNATAPIEWSSGNPKHPVHRLSRRGNRTLNHAIHIAAVTQLRHRHSPGRGYHDRKPSQGQTGRQAPRSLKRRLSDVAYRRLVARRHPAPLTNPGGQHSKRLHKPAWPAQCPDDRRFGTSHSRTRRRPYAHHRHPSTAPPRAPMHHRPTP